MNEKKNKSDEKKPLDSELQAMIAEADLVFINGLDFEGIIPSLRRMTIFVSSVPIYRLPSCGSIFLYDLSNKLSGAVIDAHHDLGGIPG